MAASVKELIEQKEAVEKRKQQKFDLTTSVGVITVKQPSRALAAEVIEMEDGDPYIIMECAGYRREIKAEVHETIKN